MVELTAGNVDDFDVLYAELRGVPDIAVQAVPSPVELRRGRDRLEITADNLDEALPLIEELMGGS